MFKLVSRLSWPPSTDWPNFTFHRGHLILIPIHQDLVTMLMSPMKRFCGWLADFPGDSPTFEDQQSGRLNGNILALKEHVDSIWQSFDGIGGGLISRLRLPGTEWSEESSVRTVQTNRLKRFQWSLEFEILNVRLRNAPLNALLNAVLTTTSPSIYSNLTAHDNLLT